MPDTKPQPDENQLARLLVAAATDTRPDSDDVVIEDSETRVLYERLKAEELKRQARRK